MNTFSSIPGAGASTGTLAAKDLGCELKSFVCTHVSTPTHVSHVILDIWGAPPVLQTRSICQVLAVRLSSAHATRVSLVNLEVWGAPHVFQMLSVHLTPHSTHSPHSPGLSFVCTGQPCVNREFGKLESCPACASDAVRTRKSSNDSPWITSCTDQNQATPQSWHEYFAPYSVMKYCITLCHCGVQTYGTRTQNEE